LPAPVGSLDTVTTTNLRVGNFTWGVDSRGGLTTPGGSIGDDGEGNLVLVSLSPTKSVKIWSGQSLKTWEFGEDGITTLPLGGTISEGGMGCKATEWNRAGNRYRDHVSKAKYHVRKIEQ
jgi:hypothetical protein